MRIKKFNDVLKNVMSFIAPFLSQHVLEEDPKGIHGIMKGISYGQGGIALGFTLKNLDDPNFIIAGFIFLFPIFLVFGLIFEFLTINSSKNGHLLSVIIFCLLFATAIHFICLSALFFNSSFWLGFVFIGSIIILLKLLIYVLM